MSDAELKIIALIPAYNEEKHLAEVLTGVRAQIGEVLVVDDGSKDGTKLIAEESGAIVLSRGFNCGKGKSLRDGFEWAVRNGYDAAVMLDADGQHDPACIGAFIDEFRKNREPLIIGARDYAQIPLRRRIPNTIGRVLFSAAVGQYIPDNQSGYRLLDREMMGLMLGATESGFHFEVEMIALAIARGWQIGWVEIPTIYGDEISMQNPFDQIFGFPAMCIKSRQMISKYKKEQRAS